MKRLISSAALAFLICHSALAADDIESAYSELKTAVDAKKGPAEIKSLAAEVLTFVNKAPGDAHAKEIGAYTEYALYAAALQGPAAVTVDLMGVLEQHSPKSPYLGSGYGHYLAALGQVAPGRVAAAAEKGLASFPDNQDLLVAGANGAMQKSQADRALTLAKRALSSRPAKPEGVASADWDRAQNSIAGSMHWIAGIVYGSKNQFFECDKELRIAQPLIKGNQAMEGPAYFYLGLSNYQLGRGAVNKAQIQEGAKFSELSAAIPGQYQRQAYTNAQSMKAEAAKMR